MAAPHGDSGTPPNATQPGEPGKSRRSWARREASFPWDLEKRYRCIPNANLGLSIVIDFTPSSGLRATAGMKCQQKNGRSMSLVPMMLLYRKLYTESIKTWRSLRTHRFYTSNFLPEEEKILLVPRTRGLSLSESLGQHSVGTLCLISPLLRHVPKSHGHTGIKRGCTWGWEVPQAEGVMTDSESPSNAPGHQSAWHHDSTDHCTTKQEF